MRRIAPLAVLTVPLLSMMIGCDDAARPLATGDTVAVGSLPEELPASETTESTDTTEPVPDTAAMSAATALTSSGPASSAAPTTDAAAATSFASVLGVFGGAAGPPAAQTISDDTRRLRLAVPRAWVDRRTAPANGADGQGVPSLSAAPDLAGFLDGYETPGLTALVVEDDPGAALEAYDFREDCIAGGVAPYRGVDMEGRYDVWRECGGTDSAIVTVAVRPDHAGETVLLLAQVVEPADAAALDHALATLTLHD